MDFAKRPFYSEFLEDFMILEIFRNKPPYDCHYWQAVGSEGSGGENRMENNVAKDLDLEGKC